MREVRPPLLEGLVMWRFRVPRTTENEECGEAERSRRRDRGEPRRAEPRRAENDGERRRTTENEECGEAERSRRRDRGEPRRAEPRRAEKRRAEKRRAEKSRKEIEADPQPIPARGIECGLGSSCSRVRRARAFSSTDAWKQTAQTGAAYSTAAAEGSEKCAASRRAKISPPRSPPRTPGYGPAARSSLDPGRRSRNPARPDGQNKYPNNLRYLSW
jgi:hypothetical protein